VSASIFMIVKIQTILLLVSLLATQAQLVFSQPLPPRNPHPGIEDERLQMGLSVDTVQVTSEFSGQSIAVFGTIENADRFAQLLNEYSVAVVIHGPTEDIVVRRKERFFGVWINRQSRFYRRVPSFYSVATNRPVDRIAERMILRDIEVGVNNISLNLFSGGTQTFILPAPEFAGSLRRLRISDGLFAEDPSGVVFLGSSLFRATIRLPAEVPIGRHTVTAYLFRNGELLDQRSDSFQVERAGFEKLMFTLAHENSFWYGIIAVFVALVTGWLASVVFGVTRS
jgi:uncharacterized protein (TIGR02186 family)